MPIPRTGAGDSPEVPAGTGPAPIVVAVGGGPGAGEVTDAAIGLGRVLDAPIEVLHVLEIDVVGDQVIDAETAGAASARGGARGSGRRVVPLTVPLCLAREEPEAGHWRAERLAAVATTGPFTDPDGFTWAATSV